MQPDLGEQRPSPEGAGDKFLRLAVDVEGRVSYDKGWLVDLAFPHRNEIPHERSRVALVFDINALGCEPRVVKRLKQRPCADTRVQDDPGLVNFVVQNIKQELAHLGRRVDGSVLLIAVEVVAVNAVDQPATKS